MSLENVQKESIVELDWKVANRLFEKFDNDRDGALHRNEFQALCEDIFGLEEVRGNEWRIGELFEIFDTDNDDLLNEKEWKRCYEQWIHPTINPVNVLLVVDVQNDFIDGTLAIRNCEAGEDGAEVIKPINELTKDLPWYKVIYSLDWHPENHISFYENLHLRELHEDSKISKEDAKPFDTVHFSQPRVEQTLWPTHCVVDSWGAQLHDELFVSPKSEQIRKGQDPDVDAYSMFHGTELHDILRKMGATHLYVCGLAYDVCVKETCFDGLRLGYRLVLVEDCCRGIDPVEIANTRLGVAERGGLVIKSERVSSLVTGKSRSLILAHHAASVLACEESVTSNDDSETIE